MKKIVQYLKVEIESLEKTQTEETLEMKSLETATRTSEISFLNRIQNMGERISDTKDKMGKIDTLFKESIKC